MVSVRMNYVVFNVVYRPVYEMERDSGFSAFDWKDCARL